MTYVPGDPPEDIEALRGYLMEEFSRIEAALRGVEEVRLAVQHRAPPKPRDGQLVYADGSDWNPGRGEGYYGYRGSQWELLGLEGALDVRRFGAKGDRVTDDAPAIQAALDYAKTNGDIPVYIPPAKPNGSSRGYYLCSSPITIYENSRLWGAGSQATELRFLSDTDGISIDTSAGIASNWEVRGLHLRGNADLSLSASKTAGLRVGPSNYFTLSDLYVQRFVDGLEFDAGASGLALAYIRGVRILSNRFPNLVNGYPRYGITLQGSSTKPQALHFSACVVYAQLSQKEASYTGDGTTKNFGVDTLGLFKTEGVQAWVKTTGGFVRQTEGVDYDLYDVTAAPVLLTPGVVANSAITRVEARFSVAPAAGSTIAITWNDPTGLRGINLVNGTGNSFDGLTVGGWDTNIYCNEDNNLFDVQYMQVAQKGFQLTAAADASVALMREYPNKNIVSEYSYASGVVNPTAAEGYGREPQQLECTVDYAVTTSGSAVDWDGAGTTYLEMQVDRPGLRHEVVADISWKMEALAGTRVTLDLTLQVSGDAGATWSTLDFVRVDYTVGGASSIIYSARTTLRAVDKTFHEGGWSDLGTVRYRVLADRVNGDSATILGSSSNRSFLRVTPVNPSLL